MLRGEAKQDTPAGRRLRDILASGALVSDSVVCEAVGARLRRQLRQQGMILDGFPRTVNQAQYLDSVLADMKMPGPLVLHLDVSQQRLIARLTARRQCPSCGAIFNLISRPSQTGAHCENDGVKLVQREDDSESVIVRRLGEFEFACGPVIEHYKNGDYHRIDGDRDPAIVSSELLRITAAKRAQAA